RRIDHLALGRNLPAVEDTAQPALFVAAQRHRRAAMRTGFVDEADTPVRRAERDEILAHEAHALRRAVAGQRRRTDRRHPVFAQQFAHRRAGIGAHQQFVLFASQRHVRSPRANPVISGPVWELRPRYGSPRGCPAPTAGKRERAEETGSRPDLSGGRIRSFPQRREFSQYVAIERALERHDQRDEPVALDPLPGVEFGVVGGEVDIAVAPLEPHREPFLFLPGIAPAPQPSAQLIGQLVGQPGLGFCDDRGLVGAGFFLELAKRGVARRLAPVDPALRHLPRFFFLIDAAADKNLAIAIQQHDADAPPIAGGHFAATPVPGAADSIAVAGASAIDCFSRLASQAARCGNRFGVATTMPSALPSRRARSWSAASIWSSWRRDRSGEIASPTITGAPACGPCSTAPPLTSISPRSLSRVRIGSASLAGRWPTISTTPTKPEARSSAQSSRSRFSLGSSDDRIAIGPASRRPPATGGADRVSMTSWPRARASSIQSGSR